MKKFSRLVVATLALVAMFTVSALGSINVKAATNEDEVKVLTPEQLEEVNAVLEDLRLQINDKLAKGETDVTVYGELSFQEEPISLSFESEKPAITTYATQQEKSYKASVNNTAGLNFSHTLTGTFLYGSGKVGKYTKDAVLTGPFYGKSETTKGTRIDDSVVEVSSKGTFQALKYAPVEYVTHIVVRLYGSGTYKLTKATLG